MYQGKALIAPSAPYQVSESFFELYICTANDICNC